MQVNVFPIVLVSAKNSLILRMEVLQQFYSYDFLSIRWHEVKNSSADTLLKEMFLTEALNFKSVCRRNCRNKKYVKLHLSILAVLSITFAIPERNA